MNLLAAGGLACLLLLQDPSPRKPPPVTVRVDSLFGSEWAGRWNTLVLEVTNQTGSDQEYSISVDAGWTDRAVRRERFAPKVRKRLFFYLPAAGSSGRIRVRIEDESGRELLDQSQAVALGHLYGRGTQIVPALMDRSPVQIPAGYAAKIVSEEMFPDRWLAFDGAAAMLIRDYRFDSLLPAQRTALLEWIRRGGIAILYPGSNRDWLSSAGVQEIAPVKLGESQELERLTVLEGRFGRLRETTPFAWHQIQNGEPLGEDWGGAVRFSVGAGVVIVLPFDLERAPFDSWPGGQRLKHALWTHPEVLGKSMSAPTHETPLLSRDTSLIHRAATVTVNRLPPFLLLLILTVMYLVTVGPVNFLVLRRLKMTVRLVFTIPAISAIFLGLVVASGYVLRGTSTVTFDVCVMEAKEGSGVAFEHHYLSVFSPSQRDYDITFGEGEVGVPHQHEEVDRYQYRSSYDPSDTPGGIVYDQTDRWKLKDVTFQQWQTRTFMGHALRPIGGGIKFSLGDQLEVINRTPYTIRKGWSLEKEGVYRVIPFGEVPPGETRRFPMDKLHLTAHENYDWISADTLEKRLVGGWLFHAARLRAFRPTLLCVLDRLPDEIEVSAYRSSESQRLCLLQVGSGP